MVSLSFGILAGLLQIVGYVIYAKKTILGHIRPNTASWALWAFGAVLESSSYIAATGDLAKNILPFVCALCAITFFIIALCRGHFHPLDRFDKFVLALDGVAILIWWYYQSAVYANLYLVITTFISFIPIFRHTWRHPETENATPWFIWTIAYATLTAVVLLRFEKWEDLVYPVSFILLHLVIAILALDSRKPTTLKFR